MIEENKRHLPYVFYAISSRIYSLFFKKLILLDEEDL